MLSKCLKQIESRIPIETMIDQSTGYERQFIEDAISIAEEIIEAKKVISEDFTEENKLVERLTKIINDM